MMSVSSALCVHYCCLCIFFFKQKTAYEMRISDWSSDVCSSDLALRRLLANPRRCAPRDRSSAGDAEWAADAGANDAAVALVVQVSRWLPEIGRASCRERVCQYV